MCASISGCSFLSQGFVGTLLMSFTNLRNFSRHRYCLFLSKFIPSFFSVLDDRLKLGFLSIFWLYCLCYISSYFSKLSLFLIIYRLCQFSFFLFGSYICYCTCLLSRIDSDSRHRCLILDYKGNIFNMFLSRMMFYGYFLKIIIRILLIFSIFHEQTLSFITCFVCNFFEAVMLSVEVDFLQCHEEKTFPRPAQEEGAPW